ARATRPRLDRPAVGTGLPVAAPGGDRGPAGRRRRARLPHLALGAAHRPPAGAPGRGVLPPLRLSALRGAVVGPARAPEPPFARLHARAAGRPGEPARPAARAPPVRVGPELLRVLGLAHALRPRGPGGHRDR